MLVGTAALAATGPPAAGAQAPAAKPPHLVRTDDTGRVTHLGPVRVGTRRASLADAYRVFGRASTTSGTGNVRRVRWRAAGVYLTTVTFGGCRRRTCARTELRIQRASLSGPRWRTAAGLGVGEPASRIAELYPGTRVPADGSGNVVLVAMRSPFGDGRRISTVTARVRGGVVRSFDVWVGDAGD